ncbi:MAG: AsmA family protein [Desulfobulbaceae bacterium]|nr:AsmA family protein [Desulfobulbaceae bacterium]
MKKAITWILIVIAGLIGLIVTTIVSLSLIIDPNDHKENISKLVHDQTGRELSIPGDIKLQLSPRLDVAFSLGEISLASSSDFPGTPFASSKLAEINLALWPLLTKKQLQINNITLENVQLNLIRNNAGKTNWEDLTTGTEKEKTTQPEKIETKKPVQPPEKKLMAIDVESVKITDINVQYLDQQSGKTLSLKNFNLKLGHLKEGQRFPVKADFILSLDDKKQQPLTAAIETQGDLTLFLSKQQFILDGFNLKGLFQGEMFPSSKLELTLFTDAEIHAREEKIILKKFVVKQGELTAETALSLTGFKTPSIEGTFNVPAYSPKAHLEQMGLPLPQFSNPQALDRLSASLGFSLNGNRLEIKDMKVEVDDTRVSATVSINNLQQPAYELLMHIDRMDLDRYAVNKTDKTQKDTPGVPEQKRRQQPQKNQLILPVHLLRNLIFSADIKVNTFKAAKLNMSDIALKADGKDGLIRLQPLAAKLYDGTLTVTGEIDARKDVPEMQLKKVLHGVQLGPMFVDMSGKEEFSGRADIQADVFTRGMNKDELTRNSNGKVKLSVADGRIARLKILHTIRLAKALLDKKVMAPELTAQPTGFATLTASGILTNGVFKNDDLLAESDLMKVTGKGSVDLVNEQINYLLTVYLTDRIERDQETGLVELGNTPIPYRIKGSFTELEQSAAVQELVKAKAKELLLDELQKHLDTGADKEGTPETDAGSLIKKGLKGLFGN